MNIQGKYIKYENYVELEEKCADLSERLSMISDIMEVADRVFRLVYEEKEKLVQERNALAADNDKAMEAMKQANEAVKLAHSKYSKLAAENAALKSALNDILQPDAAVLERNHRVRALDAMETPATDAFLAEVRAQAQSEVIEWLDAEITAIDTMYRGDPSYEHDAYWMKSNVLDVVELARKAFAAQLRKGSVQ
ncbi:hypothetical protein OCD12_002100 [Salmonella enterica]|nr:hypothetical protein [Salmonella enterica]